MGKEHYSYTLEEILDALDGAGIIIVDPDLMEETLNSMCLDLDTEVFYDDEED